MLSQNEIKVRAARFSEDWKDASYEKGETQTFYNEFFEIFGIKRRSVAVYEKNVKKLNNKTGFIDLFWTKVLLVEQKSAGRDLDKAIMQANDYFESLKEEEKPRYILACDFQNFHLIDLDTRKDWEFTLSDLDKNIQPFDFIRGIVHSDIKIEDPVSIKASEMMGAIYDGLKKSGYDKHDMEYLLTRLTYCLFADDTGVFESHILHNYLLNRTSEDGSDLGAKLIQLFEVLNKKEDSRQANLDMELAKFPYINGNLFNDRISIPAFNSEMRSLLIRASCFNWAGVSPAIFGSLFQSVMDGEQRHETGAHYTGEENILKVIKPLFLDELEEEFNKVKLRKDNHRRNELKKFQDKLAGLKFFDPACGSGNFLIIAYREIRRLELKIILEIHDKQIKRMNVSGLSKNKC